MLVLTFISLSAISAVQCETMQCYQGVVASDDLSKLEKKTCPGVVPVTQCIKADLKVSVGEKEVALYCCVEGREGPRLFSAEEDGCRTPTNQELNEIKGRLLFPSNGKTMEGKKEICFCTGNLCNSAPSSRINLFTAFSCIMIAILKSAF